MPGLVRHSQSVLPIFDTIMSESTLTRKFRPPNKSLKDRTVEHTRVPTRILKELHPVLLGDNPFFEKFQTSLQLVFVTV